MVIAPFDRDRTHAGRARGLHVAQVVAEVGAGRRREPELLGSVQERRRMGLEMRRGVAARDAIGLELEVREDLLREARRLVRHHTPAQSALAEFFEELRHAREEPGLAAAGLA